LASVTVDDVRDVINLSSNDIPDAKVLKMIKRAEVTLELELGKEIDYNGCSDAEKAGMQRIVEQSPCREVLRVSDVLSGLGFNLQFLSSPKYVEERLGRLAAEELASLREVFAENAHPRFMKEFKGCRHVAYARKVDYVRGVRDADMLKMAKLIKIVGVLLQTKVYLFWRNPNF